MKLLSFVLFGLSVLGFTQVPAQAQTQVVVIANRQASVDKVDADQATQIFLKQVQTWPDGKTIQPIDIQEGSPLRAEFYSKITGRSLGQLRSYWRVRLSPAWVFRPSKWPRPKRWPSMFKTPPARWATSANSR